MYTEHLTAEFGGSRDLLMDPPGQPLEVGIVSTDDDARVCGDTVLVEPQKVQPVLGE